MYNQQTQGRNLIYKRFSLYNSGRERPGCLLYVRQKRPSASQDGDHLQILPRVK